MKLNIKNCSYLLLILSACGGLHEPAYEKLMTINIVDRNGFTETVSSQERLNQYERVNFISNLPYDKVTRIFSRDAEGNIKALLTSYYPNGQPKQYLEVVNGRAYGAYKEWHENGERHLEATVIGGEGDLDLSHAGGWQFDGMSYAWDEQGVLVALIPYSKGKIEGEAHFYYPDGSLKQTLTYSYDVLNGPCYNYTPAQAMNSKEIYRGALLEAGEYYDLNGSLCATVSNGRGKRTFYQNDGSYRTEEIYQGALEGKISYYTPQGKLERQYAIRNGQKTGEETLYYTATAHPTPKLQLTWQSGILQGTAKTWYPNGKTESQREMSQNKKNGLSTAWYKDGSLMLVEEYERNKLMKGQYFKKGEKQPVSSISNGEGDATLFDAEGRFLQKIAYKAGEPISQ